MCRSISSPVKFKREAPPQMSSAPAGRKLRAGGWSVAEMLRSILPARKCGSTWPKKSSILGLSSLNCRNNGVFSEFRVRIVLPAENTGFSRSLIVSRPRNRHFLGAPKCLCRETLPGRATSQLAGQGYLTTFVNSGVPPSGAST